MRPTGSEIGDVVFTFVCVATIQCVLVGIVYGKELTKNIANDILIVTAIFTLAYWVYTYAEFHFPKK